MLKLPQGAKVVEISEKNVSTQYKTDPKSIRPEVVDAKVYQVKSAFIKNSVFVTLSFIQHEEQIRPIEIFINSKDLTRAPEYVVLTRLISAIFRRATDPMFILEELHGIHDPNGGSFKEGKYYHSFYAEVAETIEKFFYDVGIIKDKKNNLKEENSTEDKEEELVKVEIQKPTNTEEINVAFRICPTCSSKSLKTENGCDVCVECGYSKCDK